MRITDGIKGVTVWAGIAVYIMSGCSKDDVPMANDPAGTTELMMKINDTSTAINNVIYISYGMEFCGGAKQVKVINVGKVNGLGDITNIPSAGWSLSVPIEAQCGYIAYYDSIYYRIYVTELTEERGYLTGAQVKYQMPFEPTLLKLSAETLSFGVEESHSSIEVVTDAAEWSYTCEIPWLRVMRYSSPEGVPTLGFWADENKTIVKRKGEILIRANERSMQIIVTQEPALRTTAPYAVGDIYYENGVKGVVYKISDGEGKHGMIVSLDEGQCGWTAIDYSDYSGFSGCTSLTDGAENMETIRRISGWESLYPSFRWCDSFNTGGVSGWYLPAIGELRDLYLGYSGMSEYQEEADAQIIRRTARDKFNETLTLNGGKGITENGIWQKGSSWLKYPYHWSSSEIEGTGEYPELNSYIWTSDFAHGRWTEWTRSMEKSMPLNVRAVRPF
jgi:hypothetical protein